MVLGLVAVGVVSPTGAAPAAAADPTLTFSGHGWGHGRGMGQWGSYGYATTYGWSYQQILAHYYGGTTLGDAGNPAMSVELTGLTGKDLIVTAPGLTVGGTPANAAALLVRRTSPNAFSIYTGQGCGGPWTGWTAVPAGTTIASTADPAVLTNLLQVCEATGTQSYRGTLRPAEVNGTQYTINDLSTQEYLRGVVPRESPASWGNTEAGMNSLRAQAVAARAYALAGGSRTSGAKTCDTTACQVYDGAAILSGGVRTAVAQATTDRAIAETAGQVMKHANGAIARTEFSSSTGGWTAGGTFPAVQDLGDAVAGNGNHNWTASIASSTVAAALGMPDIKSIAVTGRNGLGAEGGRVTSVAVTSSNGASKTVSGATMRSALGLRSDWFTVSGITSGEATAVVTALYNDMLGRAPDPTGLNTWTNEIARTGNASSTAAALVGSTERLETIVAQQYQAALSRGPEPAGTAFWVGLFQAGWNVPDLQAGIYGSDEAVLNLGGGDELRWVAAMYQAILGRGASPAECQWWLDYARVHGRQAAVRGITRSEEAALVRLNGYYQQMLGRGPDPSGIGTFVPVLMNGRGDLILPALIGQSTEYWQRALLRYP